MGGRGERRERGGEERRGERGEREERIGGSIDE